MQNDDNDLRARFRALAQDDGASTPPFDRGRLDAYAANARAHARGGRPWFTARRLATVGASLLVAMVTLTIGLVLGTSTGYASARVEGERERHAIAASTIGVTRQLNALRADLSRTRLDLMQLAANGTMAHTSLMAAEAEVDSMGENVARIEANLIASSDAMASRPALALLRTIPVRNALTALTCGAVAAAPPPIRKPQQGIPVITLPDALAKTTQTLGAVLAVRQAPDGKVLVDDAARRQLTLFDSTLTSATVVLDSASGASNSYGRYATTLVPYVGDSSLFADFNSRTMLVLDAHGQVARSLALPNPQNVGLIGRDASATDGRGRLIYHGNRSVSKQAYLVEPVYGDSLPMLRADFDLRRVDTIGRIARPLAKISATTPDGKTIIHEWVANPLATVDDWAVLADGSLAIVRGQDYHIDWIRQDGTSSSTPKLPFDWKRLTDADKQRIYDSTRTALHAGMVDGSLRPEGISSLPTNPADFTPSPNAGGRAGGGGGGANCGLLCGIDLKTLIPKPNDVMPMDQLPDYFPPIRLGTTMADRDNNLWILPTTSKQSQHGELVYDVVNAKGELFERVRVPLGRLIVGFGKGGVVYMTSGDKTTGFYLERSAIPRARP